MKIWIIAYANEEEMYDTEYIFMDKHKAEQQLSILNTLEHTNPFYIYESCLSDDLPLEIPEDADIYYTKPAIRRAKEKLKELTQDIQRKQSDILWHIT